MEQYLYDLAVEAAGVKLLCTARKEDEAREFYSEITPSEFQNIKPYLSFKGMDDSRIIRLENVISKASPEELKDLTHWSDETLLLFKHYLALKPYTFERVAEDLRKSYEDNMRLEPEEFKINEVKLDLEGLATPKNLDKVFDLVRPYNQDKKVMLIMQGTQEAIDYYTTSLQKAGIHTATLSLKDLNKGIWNPQDQNSQGRLNMIVAAPRTLPKEHQEKIKQTFKNLKLLGYNLPKIVIYADKKDKPQDWNADAMLHTGATIPALIEMILQSYRNYYFKKMGNGVQK
ncbi:MAG: hypothetical protein WC413_01500 [Candidatus Nanoarchaeia archaeon]